MGLWVAGAGAFEEEIPDLQGKTAMITGANTGLGLMAAKILAEHGCSVILTCRSWNKCNNAVREVQTSNPQASVQGMILDLGDPESVRSLSKRVLEDIPKLDYLLCNAGIILPKEKKTNSNGWEITMAVNHLGHFALVGHLLPLLNSSKTRIVSHSSLAAHGIIKHPLNLDDWMWEKRPYQGLISSTNIFEDFKVAAAHQNQITHRLGKMAMNALYGMLLRSQESAARPLVTAAISSDVNAYFGPIFLLHGPAGNIGNVLNPELLEKLDKFFWVGKFSRSTEEEAAKLWEMSVRATGVLG
ncbi:hypothetical protein AAMO2058_000633100 [Amorphochlora amoebiformis]